MITSPEEFKQKLLEIQNEKITFTTLPSSEPRFIINADTREVLIPSEFSFLSVKNDHKAETIYFEIDRYYDNTDLSQHTCVIQFANTGTSGQYNEGINNASELDITTLDGKIVFGWTIGNDATQYSGSLTFSIRFYSISDDRLFSYNFNTTSKTLPILDTLSVIDRDYVIEPSLLSFWEDRMNTLNQNIAADINRFNVEMSALSETIKGYRDSTKTTYDNVIAKSAEINTTITTGVTSLQNKSNEQVAIIGQKGIDTLATIPEDYTQIDADVEHLKKESVRYPSRFANALIATAEGEGQVLVTDAWDAPVVDMEIDGASEQVTTTGAQLLDIELPSTTTKSGVTISLTEDGGIHLNGTATDSGNHRLIDPVQNLSINCDSATLSLQASGAYDGTVMVSDAADGEWKNLLSVKNNATATGTAKTSKLGCYVTYVAGTTYNVTLYPMLCASPAALPWEPYTGGQPSPSPAYPQEIKGVEHVVNSGAQLFDAKSVVYANNASSARDITRTNTGVKFTTVTFNNSAGIFSENPIAYSGPCTISCDITASTNDFNKVRIKLGNVDMQKDFNASDFVNGKAHASISGHITEVKTITLYVDNEGKSTPITIEFSNIMINAGLALPWEPYNNQQRETDLQVDIAGKNLFNKEAAYSYNVNGVNIVQTDGGLRIYNNTARTYACAAVKVKLKPNTAYTYSCKIASPRTKSAVGIRKSLDNGNSFDPTMISGTGVVTTAQTISRTFTTDENEYYAVCLFCTYDKEATGDTTFESIQLEEGGTMTAWEPYHEPQSVTIPLDEPLRGIGDVKDKIVWRDGMWGIERQLKKFVFNGSENWELNVKSNNKVRYRLLDATIAPFDINVKACAMCDVYITRTAAETHAEKQGIAVGVVQDVLIYDESTSDENTVDRFKSQLQTNPINAIFQSKSPVWEPFPAETQTALNALITHPGTTYLTVASTDVAATVKLEYVQDTRKVIDGLQASIQVLTDKINATQTV